MSEQFTIRVEARFEAAHNLREYHGAPEPLHGHSWKVEAKFICQNWIARISESITSA